MAINKSLQTALPFEDNETGLKPYVKQHFKITFSKQMKSSVLAKRIIARVLSEIKEEDTELKPFYRFHITDVTGDEPKVYGKMKIAMDELTDLKWLIEDLNTKNKFAYRHLLDTTKDIDCGYDNGWVTVLLNPNLKKYFIALAHYTKYQIEDYMGLSTWYSMRLYELLSAFIDTGFWELPITEYRTYVDCENLYPNVSDLIKRTTVEAQQELKTTRLEFAVTPIKAPKIVGQRGRRSIESIRFDLVKTPSNKEKFDKWAKNPELQKRVDALRRYEIKDSNIVNYIGVLKIEGVDNLLDAWREKNESDDPIRSKEHYCTKAFCDAGKSAISRIAKRVIENV